MSSAVFDGLYKKLNIQQREAVDSIEGPVMVIAGPGTGKTQILALRVANILLKTDAAPSSILALTFTDAGADAMRKRLLGIIGPRAYEITITTFHGFCNTVIGRFPESFPGIIGREAAVELDQIEIITELLEKGEWGVLRPYGEPLYYLNSAKSRISELKRDAVSPSDYARMVAEARAESEQAPGRVHEKGAHKGKVKGVFLEQEKRIARAEELARLYAEYEQKLAERGRYDYDDMLLEVISALRRDETLLRTLQEEYQYILADEHQDANASQNQILELLVHFHDSPNLFIVGDEKQAIYRFQGASLEHFHYFKRKYADAKLITLTHNYRSTQTILDVAAHILQSDLEAKIGHKEKPIVIREFSSLEYEMRGLAEDISRRLSEVSDGETPEIAVLYRKNKDAEAVSAALSHIGVPFVLESDQEISEDNEIKKFLLLLRAIASYPDPGLFAHALHLDFLALDEFELYRALARARESRGSLYEIPALAPFADRMKAWHKRSLNDPLGEFFASVARESGFLGHLLAHPDGRRKLLKLEVLFDEAQLLAASHHDYRLAHFLNFIDLLRKHGGSLSRSLPTHGSSLVRLMTAHKSKGLEFDLVYIVGATETGWSKRSKTDLFDLRLDPPNDDLSDDDRRLFYVALTRAKKEAIVSCASLDSRGKEQFPNRFIAELTEPLVFREDMTDREKSFSKDPGLIFAEPKGKPHPIQDTQFLAELFDHHGLSVTSLGNYLECPWKYFYKNLLRVPEAQTKSLMFGTAVHAALHRFFDLYREGESLSAEALVEFFQNAIEREPLSDTDLAECRKKGRTALEGYFRAYTGTWAKNILNEYSITGVALDDIKLVGKLDKIEIAENGREVNVVDYKTGKPKSDRQIEEAGYRRQLAFYKILLDRYESGRFSMITGELDFVEPDTKGRYTKKSFVIGNDEIVELEAEIRRIAREIRGLVFWDTRCGEKECEYCALREMMK